MAYTQADADKLKKAIATGALRVRFADREVTYRSLDEMRTALRLVERELTPRTLAPRRARAIRFLTGKGY